GTTEDERFAILDISDRGKGKKGNALFFRDRSGNAQNWRPLVPEIGDDEYRVINSVGDKLLVQTNHGAPNWRVVLIDTKNPAEKNWVDVLPEKPEPLENAGTAGGKLFATYLKDVTSRAYVYSLSGKLENEIALPGLGTAGSLEGRQDDKFIFYTFVSFNVPSSIYKYDIATQKSTLYRSPEISGFKADDYETKQVFYTSKDGTRIPMFIVYKKGLKLDGNNPPLLYGYGGFNITTAPSFSSLRLALLEQGVVYASANIRGGAEYGEKWHEAGMKLKKQNVFDDFIAAGEYLIQNKYTSPQKLAIYGGSNGGLLNGAVPKQPPNPFRPPHAGVRVKGMPPFRPVTLRKPWAA